MTDKPTGPIALVDEPGQPTREALEQVLDFLDSRLAVSGHK